MNKIITISVQENKLKEINRLIKRLYKHNKLDDINRSSYLINTALKELRKKANKL